MSSKLTKILSELLGTQKGKLNRMLRDIWVLFRKGHSAFYLNLFPTISQNIPNTYSMLFRLPKHFLSLSHRGDVTIGSVSAY